MTEHEYRNLKKELIGSIPDIKKIKKQDPKLMAKFNDTLEDYRAGYYAGYKAGQKSLNQNMST